MDMISPLEILCLHFSNGECKGNHHDKHWAKMNSILSWENIKKNNYQTDLLPFLYSIIKNRSKASKNGLLSNPTGLNLDQETLDLLKASYIISLRRNIVIFDNLKHILSLFEEHNIAYKVLKGGHLGKSIYPDIACRPMHDLDILLHGGQDKAEEILLSNGYEYQKAVDKIEKMHKSYTKKSFGTEVTVEIHQELSRDVHSVVYNNDRLFKPGEFNQEFLICYFSWHALVHGISRLIWLCDIQQVLAQPTNLKKLMANMEEYKLSNQVCFIFYLLNLLFQKQLQTCPAQGKGQQFYYKIKNRICTAIFLKTQYLASRNKDTKTQRKVLPFFLLSFRHKIKTMQSVLTGYNK